MLIRILLLAGKVEELLDILEKNFAMITGFRIIILPEEATVPRPAEETPPKKRKLSIRKRLWLSQFDQSRRAVHEYNRCNQVFKCVSRNDLSSIVAALGSFEKRYSCYNSSIWSSHRCWDRT